MFPGKDFGGSVGIGIKTRRPPVRKGRRSSRCGIARRTDSPVRIPGDRAIKARRFSGQMEIQSTTRMKKTIGGAIAAMMEVIRTRRVACFVSP